VRNDEDLPVATISVLAPVVERQAVPVLTIHRKLTGLNCANPAQRPPGHER
jgi:hypothetical protein